MKRISSKLMVSAAGLVLKCLLLAAVDCGSVWLAFSAAPVFHMENFPWALLNLLVVLLFVDTLALIYPYLRKRYGRDYSRGWAVALAVFYLLTMALTPLFYWRTPTWLFVLCVCVCMMGFAGVVIGIYATRRHRRRRRDTSVNAGAIAVGMLELGNRVYRLQELVEPRQWGGLNKAYVALRTCWEFAAPFGRSEQPAVIQMEEEIARRVSEAAEQAAALIERPTEDALQIVVRSLLDTADRINLREKLLFTTP